MPRVENGSLGVGAWGGGASPQRPGSTRPPVGGVCAHQRGWALPAARGTASAGRQLPQDPGDSAQMYLLGGGHRNLPVSICCLCGVCEQNFSVTRCLLKIKEYMFTFNSGNEKTEGILPQVRHGGAWRHQGGDLFCKAAPGSPPEW